MLAERIRQKSLALKAAWRERFNEDATLHATILALCVAIHETWAGDAWPGPDGQLDTGDDEHNWGATTLRALNAEEEAAVKAAGILPTIGPGHEMRARQAMAAIESAGLPMPRGVIHCDSSPSRGPYFVWFAAFKTDEEGANYFLRLLCERKDGGRRPAYYALINPHCGPFELAAAMYAAGYYTGFKDPKKLYPQPDGSVLSGGELNVRAYASSLDALYGQIELALKGLEPVVCRVVGRGMAGADVRLWQRVVGSSPDGIFGKKTVAATKAWQMEHGLKVDGVVGPLTWKAAESAIEALDNPQECRIVSD